MRKDRPVWKRLGGAPGCGRAFTLIEMLVVIAILVILLGLVVGISRYVFEDAAKKETIGAQGVVMQAIEAFHEVRDAYPDQGYVDPNSPVSGARLLSWLKGIDPDNPSPPAPPLADQKAIQNATMKYLLKLPKQALKDTDVAVRDGYGHEMRYKPADALGGRPLLISAGPDGVFWNADDIRSDGRGG